MKLNKERDMARYRKVMGIDSSSTGVAWTLLNNGIMVDQGKIKLSKIKDMPNKLATVDEELTKILKRHKPSRVFVEKSIFVRNPATARTLSYIVGGIMTTVMRAKIEVEDVEPATWKSFFGYKNLSSSFVSSCKKKMGNTEGKKFCDRLRKSQTWRVIAHNYPCQADRSDASDDHDIADSWGIALWGYDKVGRELQLESSVDIIFDASEFEKWNLATPGSKAR